MAKSKTLVAWEVVFSEKEVKDILWREAVKVLNKQSKEFRNAKTFNVECDLKLQMQETSDKVVTVTIDRLK